MIPDNEPIKEMFIRDCRAVWGAIKQAGWKKTLLWTAMILGLPVVLALLALLLVVGLLSAAISLGLSKFVMVAAGIITILLAAMFISWKEQ